MAKPIQESIFKSRLTITYRTNINGTVQQESLPFRLLVLGEFTGRALREGQLLPDIAEREVKSIKRTTTVNDHLHEMMPIWRIPASLKELRSTIPGKVTFTEVTCAVPLGVIERNEGGSFPLSGKARFTSSLAENGLCDMEGELRVGGLLTATVSGGVVTAQTAVIKASGALSVQYSDLGSDKPAGVVSAYIDADIPVTTALKLTPNDEGDAHSHGQPAKTRRYDLQVDVTPTAAERALNFPSIEAFSPDAVSASIPELHRLQVIKQLLADLQSGLRNRPELRKLLKTLLPAYNATAEDAAKKLEPFEALKLWSEESYPLLKIERPAAKSQNGGAVA